MDKNKNTRLAQMLMKRQTELGLSEKEIGLRHGFSQQSFNTWKQGTAPRHKMLGAIAEFLGISLDEAQRLAEEADNYPKPAAQAEPPILGKGTAGGVMMSAQPFGHVRPFVDGCYAVVIDGRNHWVNPALPPAAGNLVLLRNGSTARLVEWPVDGEGEAHVVVLREMI